MKGMGKRGMLRILLACAGLGYLAGGLPAVLEAGKQTAREVYLEPLPFVHGGLKAPGGAEVPVLKEEHGAVQAAAAQPQEAAKAFPEDALCPQWWEEAAAAGWRTEELLDLDVVMHRESRCQLEAWNREDPNGGSRGLLQINGSWTKWLRDRGIIDTVEDLYRPGNNLAAARAIYLYGVERYGFGWGPWGFRSGRPYQQ